MPGDITRTTFKKEKHYSAVRQQQGRVQLDSDWNEQIDISAHREETEAIDVIGPRGAPRDNAGFGVQVKDNNLVISAGRIYVDGILCENDQDGLSLVKQDDLPGFALPTSNGRYVAYLDVWERDITALDDPEIREVALGGPDTCTRSKTVWQVKLTDKLSATATCSDGLSGLPLPGTGQLAARAQPDESSNDPCIVPFRAGYRRLENQLYRVEIHDNGAQSGKPTFKWSRDNGTVVARWLNTNGNALTVSSIGRDAALGFAPGQWVELVDDTHELQNLPGTLVRLKSVNGQTITIDPQTDPNQFPRSPKVRRWDSPGLVSITPEQWQALEDGVQVQFAKNGTYRTGDYWLIDARTSTADVEWPRDSQNNPVPLPPQGVRHHYCALGIVEFDGNWQVAEDCRLLFPPLAEEAIHITGVHTLNDAVMLNDAEIPVNIFAEGINIKCDRLVDPSTISRVTCFVTLELAIVSAPTDVVTLGGTVGGVGPVGFVPVILASDVGATSSKIHWKPTSNLRLWFDGLLRLQNRILAHLTLRGSFIWQMNNPRIYLDGESFGQPRTTFEDLRFPTGDSRRAGNFEMWFWIVPSLEVSSLTLDPEAVPVGGSSTGKVVLTKVAPQGGLIVNLSSSDKNIAQVPAILPVLEGLASMTFKVTTSAVGDATIGASFGGQPKTAKLRVLGIASLNLSPNPANVGGSVNATVTLTEVAPIGGLTVSVSSDKPKFVKFAGSEIASITVPGSSKSADFEVTVINDNHAVGSATITASLGKSTHQAKLEINTVG